jgi:hypothetical protein
MGMGMGMGMSMGTIWPGILLLFRMYDMFLVFLPHHVYKSSALAQEAAVPLIANGDVRSLKDVEFVRRA